MPLDEDFREWDTEKSINKMAWFSEEQSHRVCPGHWCICDSKGKVQTDSQKSPEKPSHMPKNPRRSAECLVGLLEQKLSIWVLHTTLHRAPSPARWLCQGRPWMQALWAPAPRVKAHCSTAWETYCLPSHCWLESRPAVQLFREGCHAYPPLTLESCTSAALWALLGVNRIIVSRNARQCFVLIDIYSEAHAHCSFWLKANSCIRVVCWLIRQVYLVLPRWTKAVSKDD